MRVLKNALRYAVLSSHAADDEKLWRVNDSDVRAMTDAAFDQHVRALCAVAEDVRATRGKDGTRTRARLEERVQARDAQFMRRTAMDLQRLADMDERIRLRHAQSERQRWFVLGRLLARAAEGDPAWRKVRETLLGQAQLTTQEARLLGVAQGKAKPMR